VTETKRCGGYKGEWACEEDYPDHILPVDRFSIHGNGYQGMCKECSKIHHASWNLRQNAIIREAHIGAGITQKEFRALPITDRRALLERVTLSNSPIRLRSEFGQSAPMTKRETVKVDGKAVPEGWVYVVRNPDVPSVIKIGKTFPNGIPDIMSSARRFGRSELVDKFWFEEAYKAEQSIHALLKHCNLRTLGHTDCGTELFKCTIEEAMDAIAKVQSENDRPSVAVGG